MPLRIRGFAGASAIPGPWLARVVVVAALVGFIGFDWSGIRLGSGRQKSPSVRATSRSRADKGIVAHVSPKGEALPRRVTGSLRTTFSSPDGDFLGGGSIS